MEKFELSIPDDFIEDFTIYYVGSDGLNEIHTSKDELLRRLKFFKNRKNEIQNQNDIFIRENCPFDVFRDFISSIRT